MDFLGTHLIGIWLFQSRIPTIVDLRSFDLNSISTWQTPVKIAYKPGLDYVLECFSRALLPESSAFCPKNFKIFCNWGGGGCTPPPRPEGLCKRNSHVSSSGKKLPHHDSDAQPSDHCIEILGPGLTSHYFANLELIDSSFRALGQALID